MDEDFFLKQALEAGAKRIPDSIRKINEVFCGCGDPETAWGWVHTYLSKKGSSETWVDATTGPEWIAAYLMDYLGLTEHGGGVRGGWLTQSGKEALAFLNENGASWEDKREWVDSSGCSFGRIGFYGEP